MVYVDQFVVNIPGQLLTGYGREYSTSLFHGVTLYNDDDTSIIWVENQVSLVASETLLGKERFGLLIWDQACADISHMHSDKCIFAADQFRLDCDNKHQEQYFSGVGEHHQNSRADISIQTIIYMARTFMVHSSFHWTDHGADHISLWSFFVNHDVLFHNLLPN